MPDYSGGKRTPSALGVDAVVANATLDLLDSKIAVGGPRFLELLRQLRQLAGSGDLVASDPLVIALLHRWPYTRGQPHRAGWMASPAHALPSLLRSVRELTQRQLLWIAERVARDGATKELRQWLARHPASDIVHWRVVLGGENDPLHRTQLMKRIAKEELAESRARKFYLGRCRDDPVRQSLLRRYAGDISWAELLEECRVGPRHGGRGLVAGGYGVLAPAGTSATSADRRGAVGDSRVAAALVGEHAQRFDVWEVKPKRAPAQYAVTWGALNGASMRGKGMFASLRDVRSMLTRRYRVLRTWGFDEQPVSMTRG
jgi:hypothetical protein